jgi:5-methylcytosine-specific restriction endonuclease McrA
MTYAEKLRSPHWQKKRLEILQRDNWKCCHCGADDVNLQVHHLVYAKHNNPWDYDNHCYQTLCENCHEQRQELTDKLTNALRLAIKDVPTERLEIVTQRMFEEVMKGLN